MNGAVLRMAGYFVGFVATDIIVGLWEARQMRREFREYENENGGRVSAHTVTEETAGTVTVVGGQGYDAAPGDVLISTDRPDVYAVADTLDGYAPVTEGADAGAGDAGQGDSDSEVYNPSAHTVAEVQTYLSAQDDAGNGAEVDRVLAAERDGKGRKGIVDFFA